MTFQRKIKPVEVPLTHKGYAFLSVGPAWAKIDPETYAEANRWRWRLSPFGYAVSHTKNGNLEVGWSLIAFVTGQVGYEWTYKGKPVVYYKLKNGNPLDCRKCNLIPETGARADPRGGFFAKIKIGDRKQWLGRFNTESEAAETFYLAANWLRAGIEPPDTELGLRLKRLFDGMACDLKTKKVIKQDARTGRGHCRFERNPVSR